MREIIECKTFSQSDQELFANFSSDRNPIHLDSVYARRTQFGAPIVYGVNLLLWAMEYLCIRKLIVISSCNVRFIKPVFTNLEVQIHFDNKEKLIISQNGNINCVILFKILKIKQNITYQVKPKHIKSEMFTGDVNSFIVGKKELFKFSGDYEAGKKLFPVIFEAYGDQVICEIANTSNIIGMKCPGENSLFASLKFNLKKDDISTGSYKISRLDRRVGFVAIDFIGNTISGVAEAFFRPLASRSPNIKEIKSLVRSNEFYGSHALVIGGSRGIGEIVAKIISGGGGKVSITYNVGIKEAEEVANEINENGGDCLIHHLKIDHENETVNFIDTYDYVYYFATPKILPDSFLSYCDLQKYDYIYIDGFINICKYFFEKNNKVKIFYPSTIFIDNPKESLTKYIEAKIKGEKRCRDLMSQSQIDIVVHRLPGLQTDQNLSILPGNSLGALSVMLPIIRKMQLN